MSSLQSLRELISERLAAAAEEICRLCEGTIVQYEQELCRQRRLLDIAWKPQLQLQASVLPQHCRTEEGDLCNQQRDFRVEQEEPEYQQIKVEQEEAELLQIKEEPDEPGPPQIEEEQEEPEPPQIEEEQEELSISQDEEQLVLKQETEILMEIPTDNHNEHSQNRRDIIHVQNVDTSHTSESQWDSIEFNGRRYVCERCGKFFGYLSQFRNHMRTHTGERPFSCNECDKRFSSKYYMKTHMRTHTGEKPFSCKDCNKSFTSKGSLKTHENSHKRKALSW